MPDCIVRLRLCVGVSSWWLFRCIYCTGLMPWNALPFRFTKFYKFFLFHSIFGYSVEYYHMIKNISYSPRGLSTYFFLFCHLRWFRRRCRMILYRMFVIVFIIVSVSFHLFTTSERGKIFIMMNTAALSGNGAPLPIPFVCISCCFWYYYCSLHC